QVLAAEQGLAPRSPSFPDPPASSPSRPDPPRPSGRPAPPPLPPPGRTPDRPPWSAPSIGAGCPARPAGRGRGARRPPTPHDAPRRDAGDQEPREGVHGLEVPAEGLARGDHRLDQAGPPKLGHRP